MQMEVVDYEDYGWFLLRHGETLLLDVHCSHSAVDYEFCMVLSEEEKARYSEAGRSYVSKLAAEVQYSAPGVIGSGSVYKDRNLAAGHRDEVTAAVSEFLEKR